MDTSMIDATTRLTAADILATRVSNTFLHSPHIDVAQVNPALSL